MGLIAGVIYRGKINFPSENSDYIIENNVGDKDAIHIHFGERKNWKIRIHFTYEEFDEFCKQVFAVGEL